MSETMTIVTWGASGHVLAALTTLSARADPTPEAISDGVLVRSGGRSMLVDAASLAVERVPRNEAVLTNPHAHRKDGSLVEQQADWGPGVGLPPVIHDGARITVNLPVAALLEPATVWVRVTGDGLLDPIVRELTVDEGAHAGDEAMPLPLGSYSALVLAEGFAAMLADFAVV
jgi:hypothetical protein